MTLSLSPSRFFLILIFNIVNSFCGFGMPFVFSFVSLLSLCSEFCLSISPGNHDMYCTYIPLTSQLIRLNKK
ncbi:hypothetical protein F4810DRAFT_669700 [Camillea tinctor]|nr:hypothetical protein F4810DRAFT_669700 [Camillea tinctor]